LRILYVLYNYAIIILMLLFGSDGVDDSGTAIGFQASSQKLKMVEATYFASV
jgi:hypothetical protein